MRIVLVAAISGPNRVIGLKGWFPWDIPEELAEFRAYTLGKSILMGRKTYEGIGRILPKRRNILLTRDPSNVKVGDSPTVQAADGMWIVDGGEKGKIEIYTSVDEVMEHITPDEELIIGGGTEIYKLFLEHPLAELRLSEIHDIYEGDTFFPEFRHLYEEISREDKGKYDLVWYKQKLTRKHVDSLTSNGSKNVLTGERVNE